MPKLADDLKSIVKTEVADVKPSMIRAFDSQISSIDGLIKLTLGEPDLKVPDHVKLAAIKSIVEDKSHYSRNRGIDEYLEGVAHFLHEVQGLEYNPKTEIIGTIGATEALTATTFTLLNPGDKVIVPTPVFSLYFPLVTLTGATLVMVDVSNDGYILTPERLQEVIDEEGDAVKAVILNYPNNPTGVDYPADLLQGLAKVITDNHMYAISDEIYNQLIYNFEHHSLAEYIPERTIFVGGLSKSFAMTGYRMGFLAGPEEFIQEASKMHQFMVTSPSNPAQYAGAEALLHGVNDGLIARDIFAKRREYVLHEMRDMGFEVVEPNGAFYLFIKIPEKYGKDDMQFALDLAQKAKVGIIPGVAFGPGGEGHFRMSYATSDENLQMAMSRIREFVKNM